MRANRSVRAFVSVALVAVLTLVSTGCNSGTAWIARIDKEPIDAPNFWEGVPLYTSLVAEQMAPTPEDDATFPVADAVAYVGFLLQKHAIEALNEKHGAPVTPVELSQSRDELLGGQGAETFAEFPDWFLDQLVEYQANSIVLVSHYGAGADTDAAVEAFYEENQEQFSEVCMDVISDESESELVQARERIEEGADFADVAKAVAAAQGDGPDGQPVVPYGENADGDIGCTPTATLATLFMDPSETATLTQAGADALVGPTPIAGGVFMLFRVRSVQVQPLEDVRPQIEQQIGTPGSQEAGAAVNEFLATENIELNPRLGEWTEGGGYNPPSGAEQPPGEVDIPPELLESLG